MFKDNDSITMDFRRSAFAVQTRFCLPNAAIYSLVVFNTNTAFDSFYLFLNE